MRGSEWVEIGFVFEKQLLAFGGWRLAWGIGWGAIGIEAGRERGGRIGRLDCILYIVYWGWR